MLRHRRLVNGRPPSGLSDPARVRLLRNGAAELLKAVEVHRAAFYTVSLRVIRPPPTRVQYGVLALRANKSLSVVFGGVPLAPAIDERDEFVGHVGVEVLHLV